MGKRHPLTDLVWTTGSLAEAGGVTSSRIRQLCIEGRLDALKLGNRWLIFDESAQAWLASERKRGRPRKGEERPRGQQLELDIDNES